MGRAPCCDRASVKRGPWSPEEDAVLINYVEKNGTGGNWIALPRKAGLKRCGKSCRLRWLNYLRPDIKHGGFTEEENSVICDLYNKIGSRWSVIASRLPGRTDNDVKNYWNTKLKKKMMAGEIALPHATVASTSTTHIYHSPSLAPPPQPPLLAAIKTEDQSGSANFSVPLEKGLGTNFSYSHEPDKLYTGMTQFPMAASVPPSEDISAASSVDNSSSNGYSNWSTNGVGGDDAFFSELGFGPTSDFFGGYGSQERTGVVSPSYYSNLSDMWATNETKPQELYQSVTYT